MVVDRQEYRLSHLRRARELVDRESDDAGARARPTASDRASGAPANRLFSSTSSSLKTTHIGPPTRRDHTPSPRSYASRRLRSQQAANMLARANAPRACSSFAGSAKAPISRHLVRRPAVPTPSAPLTPSPLLKYKQKKIHKKQTITKKRHPYHAHRHGHHPAGPVARAGGRQQDVRGQAEGAHRRGQEGQEDPACQAPLRKKS